MCFCQMCFSHFGEEEKFNTESKGRRAQSWWERASFLRYRIIFFLYKSFAVSTFFFFLVLSLTCLPSVISFQFQYNIKCRAFVDKYVDRNMVVQHVSLLLIASWLLHYFYALEMFLRGKHESKVFFYPPEHVLTSAWEKLSTFSKSVWLKWQTE